MEAAKIFLARPGTMSFEDYWLRLYVMLSRVRTVDNMLLYGLPPREFFEAGPPVWIVQGVERLEKMALRRESLSAVEEALEYMGWGGDEGEAGAEAGESDREELLLPRPGPGAMVALRVKVFGQFLATFLEMWIMARVRVLMRRQGISWVAG